MIGSVFDRIARVFGPLFYLACELVRFPGYVNVQSVLGDLIRYAVSLDVPNRPDD